MCYVAELSCTDCEPLVPLLVRRNDIDLPSMPLRVISVYNDHITYHPLLSVSGRSYVESQFSRVITNSIFFLIKQAFPYLTCIYRVDILYLVLLEVEM